MPVNCTVAQGSTQDSFMRCVGSSEVTFCRVDIMSVWMARYDELHFFATDGGSARARDGDSDERSV